MKIMSNILFLSVIVLLTLVVVISMSFLTDDKFIIKGTILAVILIIYVVMLFHLDSAHVACSLIFLSFLDIPIKQLYTSSTSIFVLIALLTLSVRYLSSVIIGDVYNKIMRNKVTLPLMLVIGSYTLSLSLSAEYFTEHILMYQGIICASILTWIIIATVKDVNHITAINKTLLTGLLMNLCFSFLFILFPEIDNIRAHMLSLQEFTDEEVSRLQGLSFRGEAYGEYLMLCALWLFAMLVRSQFNKGRTALWLVTAATVSALIMTRSRGATMVFIAGAVFVLLTSRSVHLWKKTVAITGIILVFTVTLLVLKTYSGEVTLLDRFYEFSDTSKNIGYVPETRFYTWAPSINSAKLNHYMGVGPSFAPYISDEFNWQDIVADQASGDIMTWPHNITLLVLCTIGIYGLISYVFLLCRAINQRSKFSKLDPYLRNCYSGFMLCLICLVIEGQKFDGILRYPSSSLFLAFILIALIFTSENVVSHKSTNNDKNTILNKPVNNYKI